MHEYRIITLCETIGSLPRKCRLGRGRNLLEHNIILTIADTQLNNCVPVFLGQIVFVHSLDNVLNGILLISTGVSEKARAC